MPPSPSLAVRLPKGRGAIAPRQLWTRLTPSQQQALSKILIAVGQHLLASLADTPLEQEASDE